MALRGFLAPTATYVASTQCTTDAGAETILHNSPDRLPNSYIPPTKCTIDRAIASSGHLDALPSHFLQGRWRPVES